MTNSGNFSEIWEEIKIYLPRYLNQSASEDLFSELEDYVKGEYVNDNIYFSNPHDTVFQGDGIKEMPLINLPDTTVGKGTSFIISNTCDINPENPRMNEVRIQYCPIIKLEKYLALIKNKFSGEKVSSHLESIKRQRVSQIFYLPKYGDLKDDCIALLDRINNCSMEVLNKGELSNLRYFSLSNFGFYLFLVKLSIHLTRIREGISRS